MRHSKNKEADVFLSSAFRDFEDVRDTIHALAPERIWNVSKDPRDLDTRKSTPRFVIVDACVEQIRKSKVFICVLRDRYGSSVFADAESVSFLETEIYEAALYHANAHFFLMHPFNPDPRLSGLLDVVRAVRPGLIPDRVLSEDKVLDGIKRILGDTKQTEQRRWSISLRNLITQLAAARGHPKSDIEFLDKTFRSVSKFPDKDHIEILLNNIGEEPSIEKRLTRMWIALRELSAAPYDDDTCAEYLPLWDKALDAWTSAAAWYGLHGHIYAGRLAAVNSILRIRERIDWSKGPLDPLCHIHGTLGGRASEYYSIAKLLRSAREKEHYLHLALEDLTSVLKVVSGDVSGYLAIRGHVYSELGRLQDALRDFEKVWQLRKAKGDDGGIGEALADLGLIKMRLWHPREACINLADGVERLEKAGSFTFCIRAKKRLALVYLMLGHPCQALKKLCSAYDTAHEHHVYGQITPLMETIHDWSCQLGLWKRKGN